MVREEQQYRNTVERRRPAWHGAMGRGLTRLPLLGAPAAPSRRRRTTHEAIAQRTRASGCRPERCGFESRWSRSHRDVHAELRTEGAKRRREEQSQRLTCGTPTEGAKRRREEQSLSRPPARARCRTHLAQEVRSPGHGTCRRSSADREHLATNEGVGSSNLSDGVAVGGSVSGSAQGVVNPWERVRDPSP